MGQEGADTAGETQSIQVYRPFKKLVLVDYGYQAAVRIAASPSTTFDSSCRVVGALNRVLSVNNVLAGGYVHRWTFNTRNLNTSDQLVVRIASASYGVVEVRVIEG